MDLLDDLNAQGLQWRGAWQPEAKDALAALPDGQPVALVGMVGVVGSTVWPHFQASPVFSDAQADPLDRWSRNIATALAQRYGGYPLFPFTGPPYLPFQQWADRAEATQPSPLMLRIHPVFGLWHAYRFALALPASVAEKLAMSSAPSHCTPTGPAAAPDASLCANCSGQPCLQACPVVAFDGKNYAHLRCSSHLNSPQGQDCMQGGCLARRACPVGQNFQYQTEHAAFHMQAFASQFRA